MNALEKVAHAAKTAGDVVRHGLRTGEVSDRDGDLGIARLKICKECDKYNERSTMCSECGCFMRLKTYLIAAKCPIGLWEKGKEK